MSRPTVTDPQTLGNIITQLGGAVLDNGCFDLPLNKVREVIPRLTQVSGYGAREVRQRTVMGPQTETIVTLELYQPRKERWDRLPEW
jgi:hypothetical protein